MLCAVQVLIVDDSAIVRLKLAELLQAEEQVQIVGGAACAAAAISSILELRPDVVILDLQMPDRDGVTVLEAAKQCHPAPVVIMLTNYVDEYHRLRCEAAGADYFLDKAKQFEEVPRILRGMTERAQ